MYVCFFGNYFINIYIFINSYFRCMQNVLKLIVHVKRVVTVMPHQNIDRKDVYSFGTRALEHSDGYSRCIMGSGERFPFHIDERICAL